MDCLALRKQVLDLSWAKFLIASNINVTLTPINQEGFAHESFGNVDLCLADVARLLGSSNS
jgi:hypothetical protein